MDHQGSFEGVGSNTEAIGQSGRSSSIIATRGGRPIILHALFLIEEFGAGGSARRGIVRRRIFLPCAQRGYVQGNNLKKRALPLCVVLKLLDVIGEPVLHLLPGGPGEGGSVAPADRLLLNFTETSAVASIELLEAAARSRSDGKA